MRRPCLNIITSTSQNLTRELSTVTSTVHRGTEFEKRSLKVLQNTMSMSLRRVGGKSDGGIDLLGWWWLPEQGALDLDTPRQRLRVLAQCKAEKKKMGPKYVREMEGVLHRYMALEKHSDIPVSNTPSSGATFQLPLHSAQYPLVALLISESAFTKATVLRALSSPVPFFLLHIPPLADLDLSNNDSDMEREDGAGSAIWNPALAGTRGLLRGQMDIRWERGPGDSGHPGLWWQGQKLRSWTPTFESEELNLTMEDTFFEGLAQEQ